MKVKNITPEEKENALALIRKCGLEETEENINYYVRMQRDSKKHRGEKDGLTENNSSSCTGKIIGWGFIIALFFMIKMCGGCNGCGNSEKSSPQVESSSEESSEESLRIFCSRCHKRAWHPKYLRNKPYCTECYDIAKYDNILWRN